MITDYKRDSQQNTEIFDSSDIFVGQKLIRFHDYQNHGILLRKCRFFFKFIDYF